ncbi:peroxidase [Trypanosoma conorhini]|uniref:Peroxidase n=1 Tax=Trypanosoma conorhini TaxID=83891 RepID=A0A422PWC5_9TRYP|nr:peroxidase [Trypanosoma conorhini]RNF22109.1 peroxidase [Trypanosoma conorhini]
MWKPLRTPLAAFICAARFYGSTPPSSSSSSTSTLAGAAAGRHFRTPASAGGGAGNGAKQRQANPYKSWEHLNHKWLIMMCIGCLAGGLAAGQVVDVDENALRPPFSKASVLADIDKTFEFRPDLAATSIRVAFLLAARRAGFATDNIDESCAVVSGLEDIAGVLRQLATVHRLSTEDAASLLAVAGVKFLKGPADAIESGWRWGRNDTEAAAPRKKQLADGDSGCIAVPTIIAGLGGLTAEECVALMACHSVGEFHEHVSGLDDVSHIGRRYRLSNEYYKFLLANEKRFFELEVPRTEENKAIQRLPKDFVCVYAQVEKKKKKRQCVFNRREVEALLHNKTWRELTEKYAADEAAWAAAFQSAFTKMIESHFKRLRTYNAPSA